jgi:hypothetical protein
MIYHLDFARFRYYVRATTTSIRFAKKYNLCDMDRTCILQLMINLSGGAIIGAISGYGKPIIMKIQVGVKKTDSAGVTSK